MECARRCFVLILFSKVCRTGAQNLVVVNPPTYSIVSLFWLTREGKCAYPSTARGCIHPRAAVQYRRPMIRLHRPRVQLIRTIQFFVDILLTHPCDSTWIRVPHWCRRSGVLTMSSFHTRTQSPLVIAWADVAFVPAVPLDCWNVVLGVLRSGTCVPTTVSVTNLTFS